MYSGLIERGDRLTLCSATGQFYQLMALQFFLCFVSNGFLASIGTYRCRSIQAGFLNIFYKSLQVFYRDRTSSCFLN